MKQEVRRAWQGAWLVAAGLAVALGDEAIQYWTDYAIYPKRCITYNDVDVIMYSMYEKGYKQCSDTAMGTYVASVPQFVGSYLEQLETNAYEMGKDYEEPETALYVNCTYKQVSGVDYFLQLGCNDEDPLQLAVNIYSDDECTTRSVVDGYDDANIPLDFSMSFKKCHPCVIWSDVNDDAIDDMYYENKQLNAPFCSTAWDLRETCDSKCQLISMEKKIKESWNKADKILLSILSLFGLGMLIAIITKRQSMSNKDALLEQAAMSAAGLQQSHVVGLFILTILVVLMFALLNLKKITWALLLLINIVLFAYLMKLTVDGSVKETIIGPDGKIIEKPDSDDEDDDEEPMSPTSVQSDQTGAYENPNLPTIT